MYTYDELVEDLNIGHEIEFSYLSKDYSISRSYGGWYFTDAEDYENANRYTSPSGLLSHVTIGNENLRQVFDSGRVQNITIF